MNNLDARLENPCKLTSPEFSSPAGSEPPTKWQLAVFLHPDERSRERTTSTYMTRTPFSAVACAREQYIGIEVIRCRASHDVSVSYVINAQPLASPSAVQNTTDKQVDQDEEDIWAEAKLQPPKLNKKSSSAGKEVASSLGPMKLSVSSAYATAMAAEKDIMKMVQSRAHEYVVDNMIFKHVLPLSEVQNSHSVVFNCQITVWSLDSPKHEQHTSLQPTALGACKCNLSNIMEEARKNGHFTDVTLVVAREKEFKAHKVVLATQSQFFKTKFESRWSSDAGQQHCNNRIEMTDVPANVMEAVLSYMYTGTVTNGIDEIATEMLTTAEEYGLEGLRRMCEASLAKTLTSESVIDMLIFADNHNAVDLRKECIKYISSNASIVRNSEGWKKLNDPNIYQRFGFEILEAIAKRV